MVSGILKCECVVLPPSIMDAATPLSIGTDADVGTRLQPAWPWRGCSHPGAAPWRRVCIWRLEGGASSHIRLLFFARAAHVLRPSRAAYALPRFPPRHSMPPASLSRRTWPLSLCRRGPTLSGAHPQKLCTPSGTCRCACRRGASLSHRCACRGGLVMVKIG